MKNITSQQLLTALLWNIVPNDTALKLYLDLNRAVEEHYSAIVINDQINAVEFLREALHEFLAGEGYDFETGEFE